MKNININDEYLVAQITKAFQSNDWNTFKGITIQLRERYDLSNDDIYAIAVKQGLVSNLFRADTP